MTENKQGLKRPDKTQDHLRDARQGAYDPVANQTAPDTNQQTPHERAQPGADVRGEPLPADPVPTEDYALPEGLKRERKGPLSKSTGRVEVPQHVPNAPKGSKH